MNMNLKQTIRRILREELYSPAGEEIKPNKIVVHKSNPMFRDRILDEGLKVRVGECYQIYVNRERRDPDEIKCKPVIFATNSTRKKDWFESTYDDDVWVINTECAKVNWFKDKHYDDDYHIVTFEDILPECLKLIYKGTGESEDLIQENINDNKEEKMVLLIEKSIKTLLKNNKLYCRVEVIPPSKNKNGSFFLDKRKIPYQLNLYIVGGINSKYWPRTQSVLRKESDIVDEVYSFVRDNLPFNISLDVKYVDHCN